MRKHRSIKFLPRFYSFKCIHEDMNLHIYYVPLLPSNSLFFVLHINFKNEQKLIVIDFNSEDTIFNKRDSGQKSKFAGRVRRQCSRVCRPGSHVCTFSRFIVRRLNEDSRQRSKDAHNVHFS